MNPNYQLPPLSPLKARSTIALVLTVATAISTLLGIDVFGFLGSLGLGSNEGEVLGNVDKGVAIVNALIAHGNEIVLLLAPVWLWIERRAPNARITFNKWFVRDDGVVVETK